MFFPLEPGWLERNEQNSNSVALRWSLQVSSWLHRFSKYYCIASLGIEGDEDIALPSLGRSCYPLLLSNRGWFRSAYPLPFPSQKQIPCPLLTESQRNVFRLCHSSIIDSGLLLFNWSVAQEPLCFFYNPLHHSFALYGVVHWGHCD